MKEKAKKFKGLARGICRFLAALLMFAGLPAEYTPFAMVESNLEGFVRTESGYQLERMGLPEGEFTFSLSTSESPTLSWLQNLLEGMSPAMAILLFVLCGMGVLLLRVLPLAVGGIVVLVLIRRERKRRGEYTIENREENRKEEKDKD